MKKFGKIVLISVFSLLAILIIVLSIVLWYVFTPEKLTPIVRKQAEKYIACRSQVGSVELTFFSTFPNFGIKVKQFALINPVAGTPNDTLAKIDELIGVVDVATWMKKKELVLAGLELTGGYFTVYSDSLGHTNYDIATKDSTSTSVSSGTSETKLPTIDIRNVVLNKVNVHYKDQSLKVDMTVRDLAAKITGTVTTDNINGNVNVSTALVSMEYEGEKYLQQASVKFDGPVSMIPSQTLAGVKDATGSINDLSFSVNGTVRNDKQGFVTDMKYKLSSWPVKNILAMVPPSYQSYLKGIELDGLFTSEGAVKGLYNDSVMPLLDLHLLLEKGTMKYTGFPQPLHDMEGDLNIYTDLHNDVISFVKINRFEAKTPKSTIDMNGVVSHLFKDIYCDFTTNASLTLDEFGSMIPSDMKAAVNGKAVGTVKSAFSISQMQKMQIEKMKLSGSVTLTDFRASYDSLSMQTNKSKIDFALPNPKASTKDTKFAFANILSDNLVAGKLKSYTASLQNAAIILETSDARNASRIPDLKCSFGMDSFSATMDTMSIVVAKPMGKVSLSPRSEHPEQPRLALTYNSDQIETRMGKSSATIKKINLDTDILNDNSQKDIFLQWLVKGFVDITQGKITVAGFSHPIEIPQVKMNFEPETFSIKEGKLKIDRSDFQLVGNLNNVLSYFRGDSILRGNFTFKSDRTDLTQLMALTSGIGDSATVKTKANSVSDTTYTGPYMVPKGIDVTLNANIKTATFAKDSATHILGKVQLHDGNLLLDGLTFETPAAKMQLTALYNTPRKNHLFVGMDYHMLDVEIGELLTMIPDIDSLMPMLRSFGGRGEFHIAVETYLDSMYNVKKSTLRGASSIKGNNLTLMDGETFTEIAKKLMFSKKTQNKVDSLSAEFTIFRNEIDVFPFLLVMDKYKAVISGRHNFDLTFDYHISVVDCPLPIKLGLDIKGNMDDYSVRLAKCRYAELYRPASRKAVESKTLELRKMIRDMLTKKVKE